MSIPTHDRSCITKTYPTKCKECGVGIFHFSCTCGSSVLVDSLDSFRFHICVPKTTQQRERHNRLRVHLHSRDALLLGRCVTRAVRRWRATDVLLKEPLWITRNHCEVLLVDPRRPQVLDPLSDLFLEGIIVKMELFVSA